MKNRVLPIITLIALVLTISSCYSSRKYKTGCPSNVMATPVAEVNKKAA